MGIEDRTPAGRWTRVVGTLAAGVALAGSVAPLALAGGSFTTESDAGALTGLAADTTRNVYWTAAQSEGTVTAIGDDGKTQGQVTFGATPTDVEAVSFRDGRLWIGDIGDAQASRKSVTVYRISSLTYGSSAQYRSYALTYADQAQDAAAMVVSPKGRLYVVTRGQTPGIYRAPATLVPGGQANELTRVGDAPANVTDATFSTDGTKLVLRTLTSVHVVDPYSFKVTAAAELPSTAQGQAVTTALSGSSLVVSGSGTPATVEQVAVPTSLASVSPAPATPAASASATPTSVAQVAQAAKSSGSGHGTVWALAAAGVISVAAALVVAFKR